jgi:hypothetical protein
MPWTDLCTLLGSGSMKEVGRFSHRAFLTSPTRLAISPLPSYVGSLGCEAVKSGTYDGYGMMACSSPIARKVSYPEDYEFTSGRHVNREDPPRRSGFEGGVPSMVTADLPRFSQGSFGLRPAARAQKILQPVGYQPIPGFTSILGEPATPPEPIQLSKNCVR